MQNKRVVDRFLSEVEKKESDIHTKKWESCVKNVKKQNKKNDTDYNPYAVCTDSIGYEGSVKKPHRDLDENAKMKKGDLLEYIKNKKNNIVKNFKKSDILKEQDGGRDPYNFPTLRELDGQERRDVMKYLEGIRQSGIVNMFGAHQMLTWAPDDMQRHLYGIRMDPESLEDQIEESDGEDTSSLEEQLQHVRYLLDEKQKIRDILVRGAMTRAENEGTGTDLSNIQRIFDRMGKEAWKMWVGLYNI